MTAGPYSESLHATLDSACLLVTGKGQRRRFWIHQPGQWEKHISRTRDIGGTEAEDMDRAGIFTPPEFRQKKSCQHRVHPG